MTTQTQNDQSADGKPNSAAESAPKPNDAGAPGSNPPAGQPQDEGSPPAASNPPAGSVPQDYKFQAADGKEADPKLVERVTATAKALGLTQEAAQKLFDEQSKAAAEQAASIEKLRNDTIASWKDASSKDPEIGGTNATTVTVDIDAALAKIGTPALSDLLSKTGLIEHPDIRRLLAKVGKLVKNDVATGDAAKPGKPTDNIASVLYGGNK